MKANEFIQKTAEATLKKLLKEPFEFLVTIHMLNQKETAARAAIHDSSTAMEALARAIMRAGEEIDERA